MGLAVRRACPGCQLQPMRQSDSKEPAHRQPHLAAPHAAGDHLAQLQGRLGDLPSSTLMRPDLSTYLGAPHAASDHLAQLQGKGPVTSLLLLMVRRTWEPHMRRVTILHSCRARRVREAQPRRRQISNRQRMRRPALCVTYTMSLLSARPSSFSWLMYACTPPALFSSCGARVLRFGGVNLSRAQSVTPKTWCASASRFCCWKGCEAWPSCSHAAMTSRQVACSMGALCPSLDCLDIPSQQQHLHWSIATKSAFASSLPRWHASQVGITWGGQTHALVCLHLHEDR